MLVEREGRETQASMVALKLNFGSNKNSREPALKMGVVENSDHFFCKKANKEKQLILKKKKKH